MVNRRTFLNRFLSGLVIVLFLTDTTAARMSDSKTHRYESLVYLGVADLKQGDACVDLLARMSSGEFFNGLRKVVTVTGTSYQKNAKEINLYPDLITISIRGTVHRCSARTSLKKPPSAMMTRLNSAHFEVRCGEPPNEKQLEFSGSDQTVQNAPVAMWIYILEISLGKLSDWCASICDSYSSRRRQSCSVQKKTMN